MDIYQPLVVKAIQELYGDLLFNKADWPAVGDHLTVIAAEMWGFLQRKEEAVLVEVSNYHPGYLGKTADELHLLAFTEKDAQYTTAQQYGFTDWETVTQLNTTYNLNFEKAVDYLVFGELDKLKAMISQHPSLVHERSSYGHEATLLHYAGSNGVEMWRQQVPESLPAIVAFLLESGADPVAKMKVYNGEFTTVELFKTSAHPYVAGIADEVLELL